MRIAFLISGIVEIIGAFIFYVYPDVMHQNPTPYLMKLYGINALILGIINMLIYRHYQTSDLIRKVFLAMIFFHGAIAMMTYGFKDAGLNYPLGAVLTHLALFVLFFITYMRDLKPDN